MQKDKYDLYIDSEVLNFKFISRGPKGDIPKLVIYQKMGREDIYNLAFGDLDEKTGKIDDTIITNNGDSHKVLSTVASTVYAFTHKYPNAWITAKGSSKSRTRLYQIGISNHLEEITQDFDIYGLMDNI